MPKFVKLPPHIIEIAEQELKWHHNHMMNRLEPGDKEIIEEGERVIFHGEEFEDDKKVLAEVYVSTLNPKIEGKGKDE